MRRPELNMIVREHQENPVFSFWAFFTSRKSEKSRFQNSMPTFKKKSPLLFWLPSTHTSTFLTHSTCTGPITYHVLVYFPRFTCAFRDFLLFETQSTLFAGWKVI